MPNELLYQRLLTDKVFRDELVSRIRDSPVIAIHGDADGISSGVLLSFIKEPGEVQIPTPFGNAPNADIMADMVPVEGFDKLCFDHHPNHPDDLKSVEYKDKAVEVTTTPALPYTLVWGNMPASLIIYNIFKDKIPQEEWWKVAIGCVGDGSESMIPLEVWDKCQELLEQEVAVGFPYTKGGDGGGGGSMYAFLNPIWFRLSSSINMACRVGKGLTGYRIAKHAENPMDIIGDPSLGECRKKVNSEIARVMKEHRPIDIKGKVEFWSFTSDVNLPSLLATRLYGKTRITTIAINQTTGKFSIRGVLSNYLTKKLAPYKIAIMGGHAGFVGANLAPGKSSKDLLDALRIIL